MLNNSMPGGQNLLLIDDHPIVRMGYAVLLRQLDPSFTFYEGGARDEALALARAFPTAIALVDLTFNGSLDLSLVGDLLQVAPCLSILVVSMHDERLYAERVIKAGAKGYVMKHHAAQSVIQAVDAVRRGEIWLSDTMRVTLAQRAMLPGRAKGSGALSSLSDRELEVFRLLGMGLKKAEIAARLKLSANTVETYRSHLKQKLGMATGAELYRFAFLHLQNESDLQSPA